MKIVYLILSEIVVLVSSIDSDLLNIVDFQSLFVDKTNPFDNNHLQKVDVKFLLSTHETRNQPIKLNTQTNVNQINKLNPVKIIIHGWLENANNRWYREMTNEYLKKGEYNIIEVDWSKQAAQRYDISANSVRYAGAEIGRFITELYLNHGVPLNNFHIIGHSLGAHVSGFAGKEVFRLTRNKVLRITALDAAAPLFEEPPFLLLEGLRRTDALIVDAIHTDGGLFGFRRPLGTADFYPNGGTALQPGCPLIERVTFVLRIPRKVFCSHTRSYVYYINSINRRRYLSVRCSSWRRFRNNRCNDNLKVLMGDGYAYVPRATGKFFLIT